MDCIVKKYNRFQCHQIAPKTKNFLTPVSCTLYYIKNDNLFLILKKNIKKMSTISIEDLKKINHVDQAIKYLNTFTLKQMKDFLKSNQEPYSYCKGECIHKIIHLYSNCEKKDLKHTIIEILSKRKINSPEENTKENKKPKNETKRDEEDDDDDDEEKKDDANEREHRVQILEPMELRSFFEHPNFVETHKRIKEIFEQKNI